MAPQWHEFEPIKGKRLLKWQRLVAVDTDSRRVFVSASLPGDSEHLVWVCASEDGVPAYNRDDHYYVPADWMATVFPNTRSICELLTRSLDLPSDKPLRA